MVVGETWSGEVFFPFLPILNSPDTLRHLPGVLGSSSTSGAAPVSGFTFTAPRAALGGMLLVALILLGASTKGPANTLCSARAF